MASLQARSDSVLVRILIVSVLCLDSRVENQTGSYWYLNRLSFSVQRTD